MDYLEKFINQNPPTFFGDYEKQQKDPIGYQDEKLQKYMDSPFAYNRVLTAEDPLKEKQRLENIYHLSQYYNFDMAKVNENYDAISKHYFGEGSIESNNQTIKDAKQAGKLAVQIDDLKFDYMKNPDLRSREFIQSKIDLLNVQMPPEDALKRSLPVASAKEFMRNVPNWIDVAEKTTPFKAIYDHFKLMDDLRKKDPGNPLLHGRLGSTIVALVEYASADHAKPYIPTELSFLGGPAGLTAGAWKTYADRETASTYYDLNKIKVKDSNGNEIGLDEPRKNAIANIAGALKATAEVWSDVVVIKGIPSIDKVFEKAFTAVSGSTASTALNKVLTNVLSKGIEVTGSEITTEWLQANMDLAANDLSIFLDNNGPMLQDFKVTKDQLLSTYKEVLVKTTLATAPLALLGIGGTLINTSINTPMMENIIKRNIEKSGEELNTKDVITAIKADPEFQSEIGNRPETTILDIGQRKEATITNDFVAAMKNEVAAGVPEGSDPITRFDAELGHRVILDDGTAEFDAARATFKEKNIKNYYPERIVNEPELKKIYQETIVNYGLDQTNGDQPGLTFEQFKEQRLELSSNYINWKNTPDAQKHLSTLSPAVETIQEVIRGNTIGDNKGILIKHSKELGKIVDEAKAGGDIQTVFDYNLEKDLQIEKLDIEIGRLQELGRKQKDQGRIDQVNTRIQEYIKAKHELKSSRNELSTILELVSRGIFNKNRLESKYTKTFENLTHKINDIESPEYRKIISGTNNITKTLDNIKELITNEISNNNVSVIDQNGNSTKLDSELYQALLDTQIADERKILKTLFEQGKKINRFDAFNEMIIGIMQKSLSNSLKLEGERYIKGINDKIGKGISLPRVEQIENIQKGVKLVDGVKKEDITKAKEFVRKNLYDSEGKPIPSIQGPNAKTVASTLMNSMDITFDENLDPVGPKMSLSDLAHLKTETDLLRYLGKVELSEAKKGNLISDEIWKSEFLVYQDNIVNSSTKKKNIFKGLNFDRLQAYQWGYKIFGKQGRKLYWSDFLTAFNERQKKLDERSNKVRTNINDDKYNWGEKMYETRTLGDHEFTLQDLMFFYIGREDPDIRANLIYGTEGVNADDMTSYIGKIGETGLVDGELTQYEKDTASTITDDLREAYNNIKVTYEDATAQRLGFLENYLPLVRLNMGIKDLDQELAITMLRGTDQSTSPSNKNFTLERLRTTKDNASPIRTDLWGIWQDYVQKQEHYINMNEWVRKSKAFIHDKQVDATITENYDKTWSDGIKKYVDDIASPGRLHASTAFMQGIARYKHNVAMANLAMKSNIILRQVPSSLLYAEEAGLGNWINANRKFIDPENIYKDSKGKIRNKLVDFINKVDPSTIKSHTEYDFLNHKRPDSKIMRFKDKFDEFGMKGINAVDTMVKVIGWTSVYDRYLEDLGPEGAIAKARDWTALTQPSSNKLSLPGMYRHNEMVNAFLMFTQQPVKLMNHLTGQVKENLFSKDGNKTAGFYGLMALGLSNAMIWGLTNRRLPKDAEDWGEALALGGVSWIPGFGRAMVNHIEGKRRYSNSQYQDPAIGILDVINPLSWKKSIDDAQSGKMSTFNNQFENIIKGAGVAFGVPSGFIINAKNAMTEGDWAAHLFLGGPLGEKK